MITSNSIITRNAANKKYLAFSGIAGVPYPTQVVSLKNAGLMEITINVKTADAGSYFRMYKTTINGRDNPIIYNEKGGVVGSTTYLSTVGVIKLYADLVGLDSVTIRFSKDGDQTGADAEISYVLYSEKFTALTYLNELKKEVPTPKIPTVTINGNTVTGTFAGTLIPNKRYMLLDISVLAPSTKGANFYLRGKTTSDETYTAEIRDQITGAILTNLSNIYSFLTNPVSTKAYVDLFKEQALTLVSSIFNTFPDDELSAIITISGFVDTLPTFKPVEVSPDVLLEGKDFRFVKRTILTDAWHTNICGFSGSNVFLSFDLANPEREVFDLSAILSAEGGATITAAHLIPYDPAMKNTVTSYRINVVLSNKAVYHNRFNGGGVNDWGKSKFWETRDTVRKIPVKTIAEVSALHRYDPTLPAEKYLRNATLATDGATFIEFQEQPNFNFLGGLCRTKKMVVWGNYLTTGERIGVWMTTDGGANHVLVYDFIASTGLGVSPINTSSFSEYTGGLNLKKVKMIYPSAADKEPAEPFTYESITLGSIAKGVETVVTATSHGLVTGDIVLFDGTGQDSNWDALKCDSYDGQGFKQNVYTVVRLTASTFQIKLYNGSYDRPIMCRHVHSVNEHKSGAVIATGEEYPNGWTLFLQQRAKDSSAVVNAFSAQQVFRLNSSADSPQRACGIIMDDAPDPNILFNSDTSSRTPNPWVIEGRTSDRLPKSSSIGLWRGKLSDIDDWSKFECILDVPEPAIWLYKHGSIIVGYYQLHGMAVSIDSGETWEYFSIGKGFFSGVFKDKIVLDGGFIFEWKE